MENKWWEYYAVRYFIGTVIGAGIVAFLNGEPSSPYKGKLTLVGDSNEATFLGVGLVAALGFAYCYIASSPVLTLHAMRAHLRLSELKANGVRDGMILLISVVLAIWLASRIFSGVEAVGVGTIIGGQFGLIGLALFTKFSVIENFYRKLAAARAAALRKQDEPLSAGTEYVTSYRHLREHGNAFAIVVLEGVLAYALFLLPSATCAIYFLGIWLLPAMLSWLVGTVLEIRFAFNPLP